mmetsp:Transcript_84129/g.242898  ORF Transcript_84129/g.242898 Transcript_84129/m.242898 type:complete len:265 (+) Transcript_84129:175-969(+)
MLGARRGQIPQHGHVGVRLCRELLRDPSEVVAHLVPHVAHVPFEAGQMRGAVVAPPPQQRFAAGGLARDREVHRHGRLALALASNLAVETPIAFQDLVACQGRLPQQVISLPRRRSAPYRDEQVLALHIVVQHAGESPQGVRHTRDCLCLQPLVRFADHLARAIRLGHFRPVLVADFHIVGGMEANLDGLRLHGVARGGGSEPLNLARQELELLLEELRETSDVLLHLRAHRADIPLDEDQHRALVLRLDLVQLIHEFLVADGA